MEKKITRHNIIATMSVNLKSKHRNPAKICAVTSLVYFSIKRAKKEILIFFFVFIIRLRNQKRIVFVSNGLRHSCFTIDFLRIYLQWIMIFKMGEKNIELTWQIQTEKKLKLDIQFMKS